MDMMEYFDARAAHWDDRFEPGLPARAAVAFLAGIGKTGRVLDIACGTGVMFRELLDAGVPELVGVDISPRMVQIAAEKYSGDPRVHVLCADILTLKAQPFDAALLYNAYPHFPDKPALLEKVFRLLKPGGRFTVAHGTGRDAVNQRHTLVPSCVATELLPAQDEAKRWTPWFSVDVLIDEAHFYAISGVAVPG